MIFFASERPKRARFILVRGGGFRNEVSKISFNSRGNILFYFV